MEITFAELKLRARRSLVGNLGTLAGIQIALFAGSMMFLPVFWLFALPVIFGTALLGNIVPAAGVFFLVGMVLLFYLALLSLMGILGAGYMRIMLDIAQAKPAELQGLLYPFRHGFLRFAGFTMLMFLIGAATSAPVFLLDLYVSVRPGFAGVRIAAGLIQYVLVVWIMTSFSQTPCILLENPEKGIFEAMRESYEMMRGHRLRFFFLQLSFIGWYLLIYLSVGIGSVWVIPYVGCTGAHFYLDLRERRRMEQFWGAAPNPDKTDTEEMETGEWNSQS